MSLTIGKDSRIFEEESPDGQILDPRSSESSDDESTLRCHVCLQKLGGNFALLHEDHAHAGFCQSCADTFRQDNHECPICRCVIVGVMRVFQ